jgi:hypothetical protein
MKKLNINLLLKNKIKKKSRQKHIWWWGDAEHTSHSLTYPRTFFNNMYIVKRSNHLCQLIYYKKNTMKKYKSLFI